MAPIADDFGGQRARLVKLTRRAMKAVGKQDVLWPILFTASFIVYLVQSQSLRTFAREFVRLLDKVL